MLDEAVQVIRDCLRSGGKDDVVKLKAAIWVLESEGIVKTEKFEFINYDGNFADKAKLLEELKQELLLGEDRRSESAGVKTLNPATETTKV